MFSDLMNIFRVTPRHAEHADARFETRRHERVDNRNSGNKNQDATPFNTEDDMSVSVSALIVFLKDFLKVEQPSSRIEETPAFTESEDKENDSGFLGSAYDDIKDLGDLENIRATSPDLQALEENFEGQDDIVETQRNRAINAYQSTPQKNKVPDKKPASTGANILSSEDSRTIHILLADLESILKRGVGTLHLEPSVSFLDSLVNATEQAKNSI